MSTVKSDNSTQIDYKKLNRGLYGGYVAPSENHSEILFYDNKNTLFCYLDKQKKTLHTDTENCVKFSDPVTGHDKTIEGMADLLEKTVAKYDLNLFDMTIEQSRGTATLLHNLTGAHQHLLRKIHKETSPFL